MLLTFWKKAAGNLDIVAYLLGSVFLHTVLSRQVLENRIAFLNPRRIVLRFFIFEHTVVS